MHTPGPRFIRRRKNERNDGFFGVESGVRRSSRSDGKTGGSLYEQGLKLISQEPGKAILTLSEIPNNDPEYSLAQRALSILYYREGNYQQSIKCYERFHEKDETPESDLMLAGLYLSDYKNHRDKALALLNGIRSDENHKFSKTAEQIYNYLIQK